MREILSVDVEIDSDSLTNDVTFFVLINSYVNPQNTDDGYSRPSGSQMAAYEAAVDSALKRAGAKVCASPAWLDDITLRCG